MAAIQTADSTDRVVGLLEQAARTIDQMWRSAQGDGSDVAAVALGQASHGIHRALIALESLYPNTGLS